MHSHNKENQFKKTEKRIKLNSTFEQWEKKKFKEPSQNMEFTGTLLQHYLRIRLQKLKYIYSANE